MDYKQAAKIGAQIRQARKAKGWTQKRLAVESGVSRNTVIDMESPKEGEVSNRRGTLRAVLDALGIDPLAESGPTSADDDAELAAELVRQWIRGQEPDHRARAIADIVRFVTRGGSATPQ